RGDGRISEPALSGVEGSSGAKLRSGRSWRLQQRRHESPFVLRSKRDHGIAVDERCEGLFLFMRRNVRRHKQHLPQRVATGRRLGECQVSAMYGVEAPTEKADIHSDITRDVPCDAPAMPR